MNANKLTKEEKRRAKQLGVSMKDLYFSRCNDMGKLYGIYNSYYLTECTYNGYTKREIYRDLLRRLIAKF